MKKYTSVRTFTENNCCACGACISKCPTQALSWTHNEKGFKFPLITAKKCIQCKLCINICPILSDYKSSTYHQKVYAAVNKNKDQLKQSASGGVFSAIASKIISDSGCVFGCAYNNAMQPEIIMIENECEIEKLQGSKYVQSSNEDIYSKVEKQLKAGRKVLYSATPCYCAGLKKYLGKEYDNLYCMEIICHGVPSPKIFDDYIKILEKNLGGKIIDLNFRDKKRGWGALIKVSYNRNNKIREQYFSLEESYYLSHFWNANNYRDVCYECNYARTQRVSDIAIGDYWGVKKHHPAIDTINGVSVVITGSEKGEKLLNQVKEYLEIIDSKIEYATEENGNISYPSQKNESANYFWQMYFAHGSEYIKNEYLKKNKKRIFKGKIKRFVPLKIKILLKKSKGL